MLLALDVGNTNISLGAYEGEKLLFVTRMATNPPRMEDEYASAMLSILHLYNIHTSQVNGAVLSSVVPRLTDDLARAVRLSLIHIWTFHDAEHPVRGRFHAARHGGERTAADGYRLCCDGRTLRAGV